jgi:hypothetical protein
VLAALAAAVTQAAVVAGEPASAALGDGFRLAFGAAAALVAAAAAVTVGVLRAAPRGAGLNLV